MKKIYFSTLLLIAHCFVIAQSNYNGNGNNGFGNAIGTSTLNITDNGTTVTFVLGKGTGNFNDVFVLYIDSKTGGSSNTNGLNDQQDGFRKATSGIDGSNVSRITFPTTPSAFLPDYAIALNSTSAALYNLSNTTNFGYTNANLSSTPSTFTFTATKADLGITGSTIGFTFIGTYISNTAFRSNEGYGAGLGATNAGWSNVTFSTFFTYPLVVTPLYLNNFSGSVQNDAIQLKWTTVTESNLDKFILQKSTNGLNFVDLATIAPKNLTTGASYTHLDNQPNFGNNYYRIIAKNNTGEKAYSNVVRLLYGKIDNTLTLFPNPTREFLKINFVSAVRGSYTLDIFNDGGQRLITQKFEHNGIDRVLSINLPTSMKKGPYRVHISNGYEFYKGTFIVQ